tara:strand:- start:31857 stop:33440 length:1584 start_codon:yes stop_codon:yes gene_type:complete
MLLHGPALSREDETSVDVAETLQFVCDSYVPNPAGTPGLSLALQHANEPPALVQCGLADIAADRAIEVGTVFHLASLTKQFVALEVLMHRDRGELNLDAPVDAYVGPIARTDVPTIRQMLHHMSGFYEHWAQSRLADVPTDTLADVVALISAQDSPNFEPGSSFSYTNANYVLLTQVLQLIDGRTLPQMLSDDVFVPLGMSTTGFPVADPGRFADRATGYSGELDAPQPVDYVFSDILGDGGLYASAPELLLWLAEMRNQSLGSFTSERLETGRLPNGVDTEYGLGLSVTALDGELLVHHGGGNAGASTWIGYLPGSNWRVVVLANSDALNAEQIGFEILEAVAGQAVTFAVPAAPSPALADFAGIYAGAFNGDPVLLELAPGDGEILIGIPGGDARHYLASDSGGYYRSDLPDLEVRVGLAGDLNFFYLGRPFEQLYRIDAEAHEDAEFVGRWQSTSLPGRDWEISSVEGGLQLSGGPGGDVRLDPAMPGVWLDPGSSTYLWLDATGQLVLTRSAIRSIVLVRGEI